MGEHGIYCKDNEGIKTMKIAIMQPYLFPYIGYFSLIKNTDYFVFFDTPQYIRKGWINRNRILGTNGTDVYFTVPVEKCARETPINKVKISCNENWKEKWMGQLTIYKKRAPYYSKIISLVQDILNVKTQYISELAINSVVRTCDYLGMNFHYDIFSQMNLPLFEVKAPDEWALYITKEMKYDTYVNPPGGKSFFDASKYKKVDIELEFLTQEIKKYNQRVKEFVPGLSMLDVMMFCTPEEILRMMDSYTIEKGM